MLRITLDTNALIDLEVAALDQAGAGERGLALLALAEAHRVRRLRLCVPAIIASERQQGKVYLQDFAQFQARLARAGIADAEILRTMGRYGLAYYGWFAWTDERGVDLERQIHDVLFPRLEFAYGAFAAARGLQPDAELDHGWRNPRCDVLALWSHIRYEADVFVSSDAVFHQRGKRRALLDLGVRAISTPVEALALAG